MATNNQKMHQKNTNYKKEDLTWISDLFQKKQVKKLKEKLEQKDSLSRNERYAYGLAQAKLEDYPNALITWTPLLNKLDKKLDTDIENLGHYVLHSSVFTQEKLDDLNKESAIKLYQCARVFRPNAIVTQFLKHKSYQELWKSSDTKDRETLLKLIDSPRETMGNSSFINQIKVKMRQFERGGPYEKLASMVDQGLSCLATYIFYYVQSKDISQDCAVMCEALSQYLIGSQGEDIRAWQARIKGEQEIIANVLNFLNDKRENFPNSVILAPSHYAALAEDSPLRQAFEPIFSLLPLSLQMDYLDIEGIHIAAGFGSQERKKSFILSKLSGSSGNLFTYAIIGLSLNLQESFQTITHLINKKEANLDALNQWLATWLEKSEDSDFIFDHIEKILWLMDIPHNVWQGQARHRLAGLMLKLAAYYVGFEGISTDNQICLDRNSKPEKERSLEKYRDIEHRLKTFKHAMDLADKLCDDDSCRAKLCAFMLRFKEASLYLAHFVDHKAFLKEHKKILAGKGDSAAVRDFLAKLFDIGELTFPANSIWGDQIENEPTIKKYVQFFGMIPSMTKKTDMADFFQNFVRIPFERLSLVDCVQFITKIPDLRSQINLAPVELPSASWLPSQHQSTDSTETNSLGVCLFSQNNPYQELGLAAHATKTDIMKIMFQLIREKPQQMNQWRKFQAELFDDSIRLVHNFSAFLSLPPLPAWPNESLPLEPVHLVSEWSPS